MIADMKAVDFAVSGVLPPELRQAQYDLSKKGISQIMGQVAASYPERFAEIAKKLGDLGRNAAWRQGFSTRDTDTMPVIDTQKYFGQMDAELAHLKKQDLDPSDAKEQRNEIMLRYDAMIEKDTMAAALKGNNSFAKAVASGARGNAAHVKAILSTPGLFADASGEIIPVFVRNSFSAGVRPAEMLAGTYGSRSAVTATKKATAKGGDFLKLVTQNTSNYNITEKDCGVSNGIDLTSDDESLTGRVLARDYGDLVAGSVIDRLSLAQIRKQGKPVIVRSAMTCQAKHGLCTKCVGVQADGRFPRMGESVGVTASAAIGEPIVQGALNCLIESTLVRMADYSVKEIQIIQPGEWVLGANIEGDTFPVEVLAVHDQGLQPVQAYSYSATPNQTVSVTCTSDHPILQITEYADTEEQLFNNTPRRLPAGLLVGNPVAVLARGYVSVKNSTNGFNATGVAYHKAKRRSIQDVGIAQCWDLSVDHPDELFVLHNALIVKNTKHNSGQAKGKRIFSGFDVINQFVQIPDDFKDRAAVSEVDGTVERIEEAPQGGNYVFVNGQKHLTLPGFAINVKAGDKVEAGDQLSEGLVNPHDVVRLRGLGEGRRYYAERLGTILADSGNKPEPRNMEIIARAAVDNYLIDDPSEDDPWNPDDLVREQDFLPQYKLPADTMDTPIASSNGKFLQRPALHFTVGTRLTPKMTQRLSDAGVTSVMTSSEQPRFKPEMKRLRVASHDTKDWMQSLGTSYLSAQMRASLEGAEDTDVKQNYHYAPRLAFGADLGAGGFGEDIERTGMF